MADEIEKILPEDKVEVKEEVKEEKAPEATQEELDWRDGLPDELKTDKSLLKFKKVEDLAKSYKEVQKLIGSNIRDISPDMEADEFSKAIQKVLNLKEEAYADEHNKVPQELAKKALESGFHPEKFKEFYKFQQEHVQKVSEETKQAQVDKWIKEARDTYENQEEFNKNVSAGLKSLDLKIGDAKKMMGDNFYSPDYLKFLVDKGKAYRENDIVKIREGKSTGDLPSNLEVLKVKHADLVRDRVVAYAKGDLGAVKMIDKDLEKVKAKIVSVGPKKTVDPFA